MAFICVFMTVAGVKVPNSDVKRKMALKVGKIDHYYSLFDDASAKIWGFRFRIA